MKKILIVEDEMYMLNLLRIHLHQEYDVTEAKNGAIALEILNEHSYDLIILDIMLPYIDGWTLCKKVRERFDTPILMLTARNELSDRVKGLEIGGDDYLIKPFEFEELKARVKALLRRSEQRAAKEINPSSIISLWDGKFKLHKDSRQLFINDQLVELTGKEFNLLHMLASSPSRVYTREMLLDHIWENFETRDLRVVDTHIKNIRTKMKQAERDIKFIQTVWGVGYRMSLKEDFHEN